MPDWAIGTWIDGGHTVTLTAIGKYFDSDGYDFDNPRIDGDRIWYNNRTTRITRTDNQNQIKVAVFDGTNWHEWTYTRVGVQVPQTTPQTTSQSTQTGNTSSSALNVPDWAIGRWASGSSNVTIASKHLISSSTNTRYDINRIDSDGIVWFYCGWQHAKVERMTTNQVTIYFGIGDSTTNWIDFVYVKR